jgi:CheY-like chemotaxis protein
MRKRVLVADDNESAREGHAFALRQAGYDVVTAGSGAAALALLRAGPAPDLLVLDMMMPGLDGWLLVQRLREEGPTVRVLVATGTDLSPEWAADHGCAGFLRKPFGGEALVDEVRRCLEAPPGPEQAR